MKKKLGAKPILFPTPVMIIGTYDEEGAPNIMNAAWGGICSSEPPCISVALRKGRKTYQNISAKKEFSISIPQAAQMRTADYAGIVSGYELNKFEKTGLTPAVCETVDAPFVEEYPLHLECRVIQIHDVGSHKLVVGEIVEVQADDEVLTGEGRIDIKKVDPFLFDTACSGYYRIGEKLGEAFTAGDLVN